VRNLDIKIYKLEVIKGKEHVAEEWLDFLKNNAAEGIKTLKNERVYLESYFKSVEGSTMYLYLFIAANDVDFANSTAKKSQNVFDLKHFEYMKECIDFQKGKILDCFVQMNNLEDYV
jgi:hypothetical protein